MTIYEAHIPDSLFAHAVTIACGPAGTTLEQATAHILGLYTRGAMTDEDLCEAYRRNVHFFDWPELTDMAIVHVRNELSNQLKLTAVISKGHILHALTGNLR